jgi:hypothetical protein
LPISTVIERHVQRGWIRLRRANALHCLRYIANSPFGNVSILGISSKYWASLPQETNAGS